MNTGFDIRQKDGRYRIEYSGNEHEVFRKIFHFSEEEAYLLSKAIDKLDENIGCSARLKQKLSSFLCQEKVIEEYIKKEKSEIVMALSRAMNEKRQILLVNYASGNSQTVKDRLVEPFEFKNDFNLVWAFDVTLKQNRQFKVCRIENVVESPLSWEYKLQHHSKPVDIFRNTGDLNKEIECMLSLKARNLLIEEYPLASRYLTKNSDSRYMLKVMVAKYEGPGRFVMGLTGEVMPVGGTGFLDYLGKKIKESRFYFQAP